MKERYLNSYNYNKSVICTAHLRTVNALRFRFSRR